MVFQVILFVNRLTSIQSPLQMVIKDIEQPLFKIEGSGLGLIANFEARALISVS